MKSKLKYLTMLLLCISIITVNCKYALIDEDSQSPGSEIMSQITKYVSSISGDDATADGSKEKPYKTISAAMLASIVGDKIAVAAGTYSESLGLIEGVSIYGGFNDDFSNRNNVDRTNATYRTQIVSNNLKAIIASGISSATTVDGFTISFTAGNGQYGIELDANSSAIISNNTINGGNQVPVTTIGVYIIGNSTPKIINNIIRSGQGDNNTCIQVSSSSPQISNNNILAQAGNNSIGLYITGFSTSVVENNNINGGSGLNNGVAVFISSNADPNIRRNKIHGGTSQNANAIKIENNGTDPIIQANEITGGENTQGDFKVFFIDNDVGAIIKNNIIHGGKASGSMMGNIYYFEVNNAVTDKKLKIYNNSIIDGDFDNNINIFLFNNSFPHVCNNIFRSRGGVVVSSANNNKANFENNWFDVENDGSGAGYPGSNTTSPISFGSSFIPNVAAAHTGGQTIASVNNDYYGNTRTPSYSIGAVEVN